jgi:hypothetical protein
MTWKDKLEIGLKDDAHSGRAIYQGSEVPRGAQAGPERDRMREEPAPALKRLDRPGRTRRRRAGGNTGRPAGNAAGRSRFALAEFAGCGDRTRGGRSCGLNGTGLMATREADPRCASSHVPVLAVRLSQNAVASLRSKRAWRLRRVDEQSQTILCARDRQPWRVRQHSRMRRDQRFGNTE